MRLGAELASALVRLFPGRFQIDLAARLFGSAAGIDRLEANTSLLELGLATIVDLLTEARVELIHVLVVIELAVLVRIRGREHFGPMSVVLLAREHIVAIVVIDLEHAGEIVRRRHANDGATTRRSFSPNRHHRS